MEKKRILLLSFLSVLFTITVSAQYQTTVDITDVQDARLKSLMDKNSALLLTELNNAQGQSRPLSLKGINIDQKTASDLFVMWEVCPFRCDELEIVERGLKTVTGGYQIRNIPVIMEPRTGEHFDEDKYQEIVLTFDSSGKIIDLVFSLSDNQYNQIMRSDMALTDLRRRSMIIDFVEQFRTAYNRKDIKFLEDIFSDDALIITGKVVNRTQADGSIALKPQVEYTVQNKKDYINRLRTVFQNNARINVVFEDIKVNKHDTKANIYGVKLVQYWNSGSYSDKGYLFLLWDFKDEDHPKIHVRTWQPYDETPETEAFELGDFSVDK